MPIPVVCPSCGNRLRAPDRLAGRMAKCSKCDTPIAVPNVGPVLEVPEPARTEPLVQPIQRAESVFERPLPPPLPATVPALADSDFSLSRKPGTSANRPALWIGLGAVVSALVVGTIGATLWATGF